MSFLSACVGGGQTGRQVTESEQDLIQESQANTPLPLTRRDGAPAYREGVELPFTSIKCEAAHKTKAWLIK